jgi:hypothetical protein
VTEPTRCSGGHCVRRTAAGLCRSCADQSGQWLAELPGLVQMLAEPLEAPCCDRHAPPVACPACRHWADYGPNLQHVHAPSAGPVRPGTDVRVAGSGDTQLPGGAGRLSYLGPAAGWDRTHLEVGGDGEPLLSSLVGWARTVAADRQLGLPDRTPLALLKFLSVHHDWTSRQPWADEYAADLHRLWVQAKTLTGTWDGKPIHMDGIHCPRCAMMALYQLPTAGGYDGRTCDPKAGGCGHRMTDGAYEQWVRMLGHWQKEAG